MKDYQNKVITDLIIASQVKSRLESLENANKISAEVVKGISTYENNLVISGECLVIKNKDDLNIDFFNKIVVCSITTPDDIYRYLDARAFIVDHGGILSHAAIFSREFNKPCLMGTEIGTQIFKTGDVVEIDFNKQIAYKV